MSGESSNCSKILEIVNNFLKFRNYVAKPIVANGPLHVGALCSERSAILYVSCFDGKRPNFIICGNGSDRQYTIPGGDKANPIAAETIRQAQTTTQIPLLGKCESASTPQSADAWPKWLRRFDRYRVGSGLGIKPETQKVSTLRRGC